MGMYDGPYNNVGANGTPNPHIPAGPTLSDNFAFSGNVGSLPLILGGPAPPPAAYNVEPKVAYFHGASQVTLFHHVKTEQKSYSYDAGKKFDVQTKPAAPVVIEHSINPIPATVDAPDKKFEFETKPVGPKWEPLIRGGK